MASRRRTKGGDGKGRRMRRGKGGRAEGRWGEGTGGWEGREAACPGHCGAARDRRPPRAAEPQRQGRPAVSPACGPRCPLVNAVPPRSTSRGLPSPPPTATASGPDTRDGEPLKGGHAPKAGKAGAGNRADRESERRRDGSAGHWPRMLGHPTPASCNTWGQQVDYGEGVHAHSPREVQRSKPPPAAGVNGRWGQGNMVGADGIRGV